MCGIHPHVFVSLSIYILFYIIRDMGWGALWEGLLAVGLINLLHMDACVPALSWGLGYCIWSSL